MNPNFNRKHYDFLKRLGTNFVVRYTYPGARTFSQAEAHKLVVTMFPAIVGKDDDITIEDLTNDSNLRAMVNDIFSA